MTLTDGAPGGVPLAGPPTGPADRSVPPPATWTATTGSSRLRRIASDVVYGLLGGIDVVQGVVKLGQERNGWWSLAVVVTTVPVVVVLVRYRRTHPLWPLAVMVPALVAGFTDVLMPLALFALAVRRRDWLLPATAAAAWVLFTVGGIWRGPGLVSSATAGGIVALLAVSAGAYVGARRDLLASLRERAEQAEATAALLQRQARLSERTRIAREMHDVVAHRISLVALHAGALEVNPASGPHQVEKAAALIGSTARQALEDLRDVLGVLRSDPDASVDEAGLAPQPRLEDVPRLVEASSAAGVPVTFEDRRPGGGSTVDEVVGRTVYRVVQEALTNVHKHAGAAATRVVLAAGDGVALAVEVTNTRSAAPPGAPVPGAGAGLVGLRERVALAGGALDAGPLPAGGWRVRATFPGRAA